MVHKNEDWLSVRILLALNCIGVVVILFLFRGNGTLISSSPENTYSTTNENYHSVQFIAVRNSIFLMNMLSWMWAWHFRYPPQWFYFVLPFLMLQHFFLSASARTIILHAINLNGRKTWTKFCIWCEPKGNSWIKRERQTIRSTHFLHSKWQFFSTPS